jgi:hypothetical protein
MSDGLYGTDEHRLFRATVHKFVQEELVPRARDFDAMGRIDKRLYRQMGELGLLGLRYDPRWGGAGLDWSYSAILRLDMVPDLNIARVLIVFSKGACSVLRQCRGGFTEGFCQSLSQSAQVGFLFRH